MATFCETLPPLKPLDLLISTFTIFMTIKLGRVMTSRRKFSTQALKSSSTSCLFYISPPCQCFWTDRRSVISIFNRLLLQVHVINNLRNTRKKIRNKCPINCYFGQVQSFFVVAFVSPTHQCFWTDCQKFL